MVEIQINQVALEKYGSKKAVIVVGESSELIRLSVTSSDGTHMLEAPFNEIAGFTEWGIGKKYYRADFSELDEDGTFRLVTHLADGSVAQSASFVVGNQALFELTMADVLDYFVANRNTSERDRAIPLIDNVQEIDVYVGWYDAVGENGNYL